MCPIPGQYSATTTQHHVSTTRPFHSHYHSAYVSTTRTVLSHYHPALRVHYQASTQPLPLSTMCPLPGQYSATTTQHMCPLPGHYSATTTQYMCPLPGQYSTTTTQHYASATLPVFYISQGCATI